MTDGVEVPERFPAASVIPAPAPERVQVPLIPLAVPHFGWRERMALWRATGGATTRMGEGTLRHFEARVAASTDAASAVATTSATAALALALRVLGVEAGDEVLVPMLVPQAVIAPLLELRAHPVFVDVHPDSWTLDPTLVAERLEWAATRGRLPKAVIAVDLFGHPCDYTPLMAACAEYGVPLIEDASHAVGAMWRDRRAGGVTGVGVVSFGPNKLVSMSGGGALLLRDVTATGKARQLAGRLPEEGAHDTERALGIRLSPIMAPLGCAQLDRLASLVAERRSVASRYARWLRDLSGVQLQPEAKWARSSRWLSVLSIDATVYGTSASTVRDALRRAGIATCAVRPPVPQVASLANAERIGGEVAMRVHRDGVCLPSGAQLSREEQYRVIAAVRQAARR